MAVTDGNQFGGGGPWSSTSSPNFLGTTDADIFQDGDDFALSFAPASAIGMYFITADPMFDDDIILTAGGESVGLLSSAGQTLPDGSEAFFMGIIDNENALTTADITTIGGGYFLYNVDDIVTAEPIPEPATILLVGTGVLGIFGRMRRRRSKG